MIPTQKSADSNGFSAVPSDTMTVIKRDGRREEISFDKILKRIKGLANGVECGVRVGPPLSCDYTLVAQRVITELVDGIKTSDIDECAASICMDLDTRHPHYGLLGARIVVANMHKNTMDSFTDTMKMLYRRTDASGHPAPVISKELYKVIMVYGKAIDAVIEPLRDYQFAYFGCKTLEKSSFLKRYTTGSVTVSERPCHAFMRVALGIHLEEPLRQIEKGVSAGETLDTSVLDAAFETYRYFSTGALMHATPTLLNAGTPTPQLSSCFLLGLSDSITGIFDCLHKTASISRLAGGIGIHVSNIRSTGAIIRGSNGVSSGLVPMLRVFNETARYVNQGGSRPGAFAIYLEPWHADILDFLNLKKTTGNMNERALDLFYGLWIPDLFMRRVEQALTTRGVGAPTIWWSLMCPDACPGLADVYGEAFDELYVRYEKEGRARRVVDVLEIWDAILASQQETGTPYMCYKDHVNRKSNQSNIGVIKSSNLCTEIMEYSSPDESAVCNLASLVLNAFVKTVSGAPSDIFDHAKLGEVTRVAVRNLNKIIDLNHYPTPCTERSNRRHRPIGLGVQGLADVFCMLRLPFDSDEAGQLNRDIFETIYYHAVHESMLLAQRDGPYETFAGSPASRGQLQPDLWGVDLTGSRWDWVELRALVQRHGLRNSLLVAPMPTATTAQILGNNECFEPYTYNLYNRSVKAGTFKIFNRHLQKDLLERGLYTKEIIEHLIADEGSVQNIPEIPEDLKQLYRTSFEIKTSRLIDMAAQRAPFIDQSQSLNIFMRTPTADKLSKVHLYGWKKGLKTGMYYLRREAVHRAQQFTVAVTRPSTSSAPDQESNDGPKPLEPVISGPACRRDNPNCESCQ